jgi:hypothetical protein
MRRMQPDPITAVRLLCAADPATCDRAGLTALVEASQRVRAWLDALDAAVAVCAARLPAEDAAGLLRDGGRRTSKDAEAVVRRGVVCELLPGLHVALAEGVVSAGHADAVGRVAADLDETARARLCELESWLVAAAAEQSVEVFQREMSTLTDALSGDDGLSRHERRRRQRCVKRWVDRQTGLCHTHLTLDPEADAAVGAALSAATWAEQQATPTDDDRTVDQVRADALSG